MESKAPQVEEQTEQVHPKPSNNSLRLSFIWCKQNSGTVRNVLIAILVLLVVSLILAYQINEVQQSLDVCRINADALDCDNLVKQNHDRVIKALIKLNNFMKVEPLHSLIEQHVNATAFQFVSLVEKHVIYSTTA